MNHYYLLASFLVAFASTFFITPKVIEKCVKYGFLGKDMHKKGKVQVAEMGGLSIILGFCLGVFLFIALSMIRAEEVQGLTALLASVSSVLIVFTVGVIDDLFKIRWRTKIFLPLIAAVPLMALRIGNTVVSLPLLGNIDLGLAYIFVLVPLGITGAANAVNMVGGYNGMEIGLGSLILASLLAVSLKTGSVPSAVLLVSMLGALLALLKYNWYPAKIFPGDSGTLQIGAVIASAVIVGNMEKIGVMLFALYFFNLCLMLVRIVKTEKVKFSSVTRGGRLTAPHPFNVHYLATRLMRNPTEKQLVLGLFLAQGIVCVVSLAYYFFY
jgi:UDP-N-acetylglucosamine--dolichyl-phosphate N-acetylglucosaminephosphotransferase